MNAESAEMGVILDGSKKGKGRSAEEPLKECRKTRRAPFRAVDAFNSAVGVWSCRARPGDNYAGKAELRGRR